MLMSSPTECLRAISNSVTAKEAGPRTMYEIRKEKRNPEKLQVLLSRMAEPLLTEAASTDNVSSLRANISETGLVLLINEQKGEKEEIRDERDFSWCCSFPWGFGCRGTERRLASWRAAAECGSQTGRRS